MEREKVLAALRGHETWEGVAAWLGVSLEGARTAVRDVLSACAPSPSGEVLFPYVNARVVRDEWGVPHVTAGSIPEAYYGLGFAMGQDRLWQIDLFRRTAYGTLAELLGPAGLEQDRIARTLDLRRVAEAGYRQLSGDDRDAVDYFTGGLNMARLLARRDGWPFEYALLEHEPEAWEPADVLAALRGFWWQLTGRFPVICVPEFARRVLGDTPLVREFLTPEGGQETIWPRGVEYPQHPRWEHHPGPAPRGSDSAGTGSNNWVVGASRSANGMPLLATDPHVPFALPSHWYEARIRARGLDAAGAFMAGVPGIFFGQNRDVAWCLTNNISSLRDLYVEVTADFDPDRYLRPDGWKGFTTRREVIQVRGADPVELTVRETDHGPLVSDLLPAYARTGENVSVRWVGLEPTEELEAMLGYARAGSVPEFREHLRRWSCPTFNFMMADRHGEIGYQLTGRIPLRRRPEYGYRSGAEAADQWAGFIPFEALPATGEPPEGWLASANNVVATEEWPYPLTGTWPSDYRMQRLVQYLNGPGRFSDADMARGQMDEYSPRAADWAGPAVAALRGAGVSHPLLEEVAEWDSVFSVDSRPAVVFEAFFLCWARAVILRRFPESMLPTVFPLAAGVVERLLEADAAGWFQDDAEREAALRGAWESALTLLEERLGADPAGWAWGRMHTLTLHHPLARTPVLRDILERGPVPHGGTWNTLNNSLYEPHRPFESFTGVSYRLLVDLGGGSRSALPGGQSGHPGSPHYADQIPLWQTGGYHPVGLPDEVTGPEWYIHPE